MQNSLLCCCHVPGCFSDRDCPHGSYCTSKNVCAYPTERYCHLRACGVGDSGACEVIQFPDVDRTIFHIDAAFDTLMCSSQSVCFSGLNLIFKYCHHAFSLTYSEIVDPALPFSLACVGCNAIWDNFKKGGCDDGLACGVDNCAVFHAIGPRTGLTESSDCCEGK